MNGTQIVFIGVAAVVLISAFLVVTTRKLIHAALWLIATLFGVAILYALLNAGFLAVVQVVIYIGAIAILFIFAVMLTRKELQDQESHLNRYWWLSAIVAALTFAGVVWMLQGWSRFEDLPGAIPPTFDAVRALGDSLVAPDAFVVPFEVASILLLAALIGAAYIAFTRKQEPK